MPRVPRSFQSGLVYHVINRGNGQARVFRKPQDYEASLIFSLLRNNGSQSNYLPFV